MLTGHLIFKHQIRARAADGQASTLGLWHEPSNDQLCAERSPLHEPEIPCKIAGCHGNQNLWPAFSLELTHILNQKGENILFLELDQPNRTTKDYESPTLAPHLQAALDTALRDEDELEVDNPWVYSININTSHWPQSDSLSLSFNLLRQTIRPKSKK